MTGASVLLLREPLAPVPSGAVVLLISVTTGPPAPVLAGPPGSATSAMATGCTISIGFANTIVAFLSSILLQEDSVPPTPVVAGDRCRSMSVYCRWVWDLSGVGLGVKLFAQGDRGNVRVPRTPRV